MTTRTILRGLLAAGAIGGVMGAVASARKWGKGYLFPHEAHVDLYSLAAAFSEAPDSLAQKVQREGAESLLRGWQIDGVKRTFLTSDSGQIIDGTRVLAASPNADALAQVTGTFLKHARLKSVPQPLADLEHSALLDLHSLTWALPTPIAALTANWRYTWPRDAAHTIVALAERGFNEWALNLLNELASMQRPNGTFEARYLPGTNVSPDQRPAQFDGTGWFLWAAGSLARLDAPSADATFPTQALTRTACAVLDATANPSRLPAPSPDYWEVPEQRLTLGVAAMTLSALQNASLLAEMGLLEPADDVTAEALSTRAAEVEHAIVSEFGPAGYKRYAGCGGYDAGLLMLLPPYVSEEFTKRHGVAALLDEAFEQMKRPAGGVAPGVAWKMDGISWTPQTAMFAQAHAHTGNTKRAIEILTWIAEHRTRGGAIPEKVLASGAPAAVAPLNWPASVVLSTLKALN